MADYLPTIVSGNALDIPSLQNAIEDLAVLRGAAGFSSLTSYDPGTGDLYDTISSLSVSVSMATDELAFIFTNVSISAPDQLDRWKMQLRANGTPANTFYYISSKTGDDTGEVDTMTLLSVFSGLSGSVTFETVWARAAASGDAIYARRGTLDVIVFKNRSA
jgi:hypothetical protein